MMKKLNKFNNILMAIVVLGLFFTFISKNAYAVTTDIVSGIYEVENDVYHESETGMAMSRTYLLPSMNLEVTKEHVIYTIGFSGNDYMENYRIKVNGEEVPVEIVEDGKEEGNVKLKVKVDKIDADMDALIYVGPMERDVEFKVIPKLETLNLMEEIKDESEEELVLINDENSEAEEIKHTTEKSNVTIVIAGAALILVAGAVIVTKLKNR